MEHLSDLQIAAVIDQGIPQNQWTHIEQHLQHCGYCASRVEETRAVITAITELAPGLWEQVAETFFRLRLLIPVQIRLMRAHINATGFPAGLRFVHQTSGMLKEPSSEEVVRVFLEIPSPDDRFLYKLSWQPSSTNITDVDFQVVDGGEQLGRSPATVQLRKKDSGQMQEWRRTDENGRVIFKELVEGDYLIQVTYEGLTVEIPFSLKVQTRR